MKYLLPICLILCGCTSLQNRRVLPDGTQESTTYLSLFKMGQASRIEATVQAADYTKNVSVGRIETSGDAKMVEAVYKAGFQAAVDSFK